jgi:hypothetical protein
VFELLSSNEFPTNEKDKGWCVTAASDQTKCDVVNGAAL